MGIGRRVALGRADPEDGTLSPCGEGEWPYKPDKDVVAVRGWLGSLTKQSYALAHI